MPLRFTTIANIVGSDNGGVEISCPAGKKIRLRSVSFNFVTDAFVITRDLFAQIDYGALPNVAAFFRVAFPGPSVIANSNVGVSFVLGANPSSSLVVTQGPQLLELPDFWSDKSIRFFYDCPNLQSADQLTNWLVSWDVEDV